MLPGPDRDRDVAQERVPLPDDGDVLGVEHGRPGGGWGRPGGVRPGSVCGRGLKRGNGGVRGQGGVRGPVHAVYVRFTAERTACTEAVRTEVSRPAPQAVRSPTLHSA
ncbi:hypothetical protein GCM10010222_67100 [Streptomyces tanashiensis]|nr:hypothetical protein GCM10010222_67100 [Streptomyces tanashiensis]